MTNKYIVPPAERLLHLLDYENPSQDVVIEDEDFDAIMEMDPAELDRELDRLGQSYESGLGHGLISAQPDAR